MSNFNKFYYFFSIFFILFFLPFSQHGSEIDISDEDRRIAANEALSKVLRIEGLKEKVTSLLLKKDFKSLEAVLKGFENDYKENVIYEAELIYAYESFDQKDGVQLIDLNRWILKYPGSYWAYAARGNYFFYEGMNARGTAYIKNTPEVNLRSMRELHALAKKDLNKALDINPNFVLPYGTLISIAKTVGDHTKKSNI